MRPVLYGDLPETYCTAICRCYNSIQICFHFVPTDKAMRTSSALLILLLSLVVFYTAFQYGKQRTVTEAAEFWERCSATAMGGVERSGSRREGDDQLVTSIDEKPCAPGIIDSTAGDGKDDRFEYPVCFDYSQRNFSSLHLAKATVATDVFSDLHHPSSPAKWTLFMLHQPQRQQWQHVLDSPCEEVYLTRTGSRPSQPNKCVAVARVPDRFVSNVQASHRYGFTARNTDQYQQDYARDYYKDKRASPELTLLAPLLQELESLRREFHRKMGDPIGMDGARRSTTVMVANEGVMDILLNFLCSSESIDMDLKTVIVFVGNEDDVELIESMGATALYSPALGSMPKHAANSYLDNTFSRMMWFKVTSVYLALTSGFNVLFQDVDLVWLKDPFPYFFAGNLSPQDIIFMDDGARTPRYTPFFVNSGFYYVKHNPRTLYLFETMMKNSAGGIGQTHSHQSVLIRHIAEAHHLFGLRVYVLDSKLFCSGQTYHENKKLIVKIQQKTYKPYVFHMCWTDNRQNKVVYFKDIGMWYLPDSRAECNSGKEMRNFMSQHKGVDSFPNIRDRCCLRNKYWPKDK